MTTLNLGWMLTICSEKEVFWRCCTRFNTHQSSRVELLKLKYIRFWTKKRRKNWKLWSLKSMQRKRYREVNYRYNIIYPDGKFPPRDLSIKWDLRNTIWHIILGLFCGLSGAWRNFTCAINKVRLCYKDIAFNRRVRRFQLCSSLTSLFSHYFFSL